MSPSKTAIVKPARKSSHPLNDVQAYLASVSEPAHSTLQKVRAAIRAAAPPGATESINYGIPTFNHNGPLLGFAAFPSHCALYPMNGSTVAAFQKDLKDYKTSKGAIHFPLDKPLPTALIRKLVKFRLKENELKNQH
jgi:uncharacterized protein YdhG (YjbR/CyaY superfamily)